MLNDFDLEYFKEENSGHNLLYVRFSDSEFIFRDLSVKEYESLLRLFPDDEHRLETAICNFSCIYPDEYEFSECPYGYLPTRVAPLVKEISNIDDLYYLAENQYYNEKANYPFFQECLDLVKAFLPEYSYEEMENWTWTYLMKMVVRAEKIALYKGFNYHLNFDYYRGEPLPEDEVVKNLLNNKYNPILYYKDRIEESLRETRSIRNDPFIIGMNWNNEDILNGFRNQKAKQTLQS